MILRIIYACVLVSIGFVLGLAWVDIHQEDEYKGE